MKIGLKKSSKKHDINSFPFVPPKSSEAISESDLVDRNLPRLENNRTLGQHTDFDCPRDINQISEQSCDQSRASHAVLNDRPSLVQMTVWPLSERLTKEISREEFASS